MFDPDGIASMGSNARRASGARRVGGDGWEETGGASLARGLGRDPCRNLSGAARLGTERGHRRRPAAPKLQRSSGRQEGAPRARHTGVQPIDPALEALKAGPKPKVAGAQPHARPRPRPEARDPRPSPETVTKRFVTAPDCSPSDRHPPSAPDRPQDRDRPPERVRPPERLRNTVAKRWHGRSRLLAG